MRCTCEQASREARREALEEAATMLDMRLIGMDVTDIEDRIRIDCCERAAEDIRALKDKPETK